MGELVGDFGQHHLRRGIHRDPAMLHQPAKVLFDHQQVAFLRRGFDALAGIGILMQITPVAVDVRLAEAYRQA